MRRNNLTLTVFILIIMTDIAESIAQTFMKLGLNNLAISNITIANLWEFLAGCASSGYVWLGVFVFFVNFFLWITVLSRVDLSVAHPVGSTSYIFVPILAMLFLHESISPLRWLGIILIVCGIHFVAKSTKMETMPL